MNVVDLGGANGVFWFGLTMKTNWLPLIINDVLDPGSCLSGIAF